MDRKAQTHETTEQIRQWFADSPDVHMNKFAIGKPARKQTVYLIFAEGLADSKPINE